MKVAIIGSGGREHAIFWKLSQSKLVEKVFVLPGNGGTQNNVDIDTNDFEQILHFCRHNTIELLFVGPEDPLANGIVDYFEDTPVLVFGPEKRAALLESSKIWSKKFMQKYGVATADFWEFDNTAESFEKIDELDGNCVIKYDGLAAGKGVFVCSSKAEAKNAVAEISKKYGEKSSFLIEEKLVGKELSLLAFTDGKNYQLLLPSQDHKQLLDDDKGPNTGGMGAFCPVPFYDENLKLQIEKEIIIPTMQGISNENFNYKGVLYFGVMITEDGPKLLEYNVRLGDPETEVVLPSLKSDFAELILACFDGSLKNYQMKFSKNYFVDVVLASGGYPHKYEKNYEIKGLQNVNESTLLFHAGTKKNDDKILTNGGRVLNVVSKGETLQKAIENVYVECEKIKFTDVYFRKDIGKRK
ncbi:MAG: phosphoribosylamine--glycine ligase [Candidatus Cloacimonetes bacterium]|jgi:phosphoribosylamine---glycine ligase|nr:phosphoribosylamine--glycine ligase [Candidatus Cloacimonadota bacterium]MBT6993782.1 phosphoribosylamine--glycine ligase [Candidatus Cloacimonadota bacterium]MBT7469857.1 phosphoribosylamine--glycine ligase [Candidatus Cloacimonadota bacterium]